MASSRYFALILDLSSVSTYLKADIGVKNGKIAGIGKAGNPDIMDGVTDGMVVGSCTEVCPSFTARLLTQGDANHQAIAGEKLILTAGALDVHVHYICTQLWTEVRQLKLHRVHNNAF